MTVNWRSLLAFVLLTFLISWTAWGILAVLSIGPGEALDLGLLLFIIGGLGPPIAAVIVTRFTEGSRSMRQLLGRLLRWRVDVRWYGVAVLLPAVFVISALLLDWLFRGEHTPIPAPDFVLIMVVLIITQSIFFGGLEEIAWRGYALPRLQSSLNALTTSLVLGVVWAIWHAPLFVIPGTTQTDLPAVPYFLVGLALAVLFTWIYNSTRGSLLLAVLLHGSFNAWLGSIVLLRDGIDSFTFWAVVMIVYLIALIVIALYGTEHLAKTERQKT